jgi:SPP1 gp7 family putative phage head morphogenesis protein
MKAHACNQTHPRSALNAVRKYDPTHTLALRNRFIADLARRFKALKRDIITTIVDRDALGLKKDRPRIMEAARELEFNFPTSVQKIDAFMKWLREQQERGILEIIERPRSILSPPQAEPWANLYLRSAYEKGVVSADAKLARAGVEPIRPAGPSGARIVGVFDQPQHADRAATIFTRAFSDLEGITEAMDTQISRILTEGLLYGGGPEQLAREIAEKVDGIGLNRARTLARTEIVRAHHLATIQEFKNAAVNDVQVQAEYTTAEDPCPVCEPYAGQIMSLDEAEKLIPQHPNCRCSVSPYIPGIA